MAIHSIEYLNARKAAFPANMEGEIARILREIADKVERQYPDVWCFETIHDLNGNDVGRWALKDRAYKMSEA